MPGIVVWQGQCYELKMEVSRNRARTSEEYHSRLLLHLHHSRIHLCHLRHLRHLHLQHVHLLRRIHEWCIRHAKVWIECVWHLTILRRLGLHLLEQSGRIGWLDVVFWSTIRSLSDLKDPEKLGAVV